MDILKIGTRVKVSPSSNFKVQKPYTGIIEYYNELSKPNPKYTVRFNSPVESSNTYQSRMNKIYNGTNANGDDFSDISTMDVERSSLKVISGGTRRFRRNRNRKNKKSRRN